MAGFQAPFAGWFCAPADNVMVISTIHMMTLRHSTLGAGRASEPF
jgi:hypothetical protein